MYQKWQTIREKSMRARQKIVEKMNGKENIYWYESAEYQPVAGVKSIQ